jgi:hypothetical protein
MSDQFWLRGKGLGFPLNMGLVLTELTEYFKCWYMEVIAFFKVT